MTKKFANLQLHQMDYVLTKLRNTPHPTRPNIGWVQAIRQSSGMSASALARKLSVTPRNISKLEKAEADEKITLASLRKLASALDCELQYTLVPRKPLEELLEEFSITHIRKSSALALSGGERRRVEIARALATNPSFILLDEPFAGIDPISISDIRDLVKELKTRGIGVLITDHNVRETLDIVDRACIIYGGQVLFAGSPEALVADPNVRRLYLGESFAM